MSVLEELIYTDPILILTGAGISKESGLSTFRDPDGIWSKYRIEDVATPEAFQKDPKRVLDFYNVRRSQMNNPLIKPNKAHIALADLEEFWPGGVLLVSQNIDDLHERGGSKKIIHMHGELSKSRCNNCDEITYYQDNLSPETKCDNCGFVGSLRPHVVWFGEQPLYMDQIYTELRVCGLFLSIGTSGNVYPAAGFVQEARQNGASTVELNLEKSEVGNYFHESHYGPATDLVPMFVSKLRDLL
ncbi:MAG: NAD-dependent protein deacylase [Alphaproteobacteria bacterium]|jgi:NAD-dependent deacetylase|nr:NAD-dependent protein deacylase [Alphaproteobacteria bacterium]PPR14784.1 MAG: NAD-dependent protein deacylase [Alphaproteobacteria bacterium MarineAlpha12_Bin1]|tara:strand:- start:10778 stop:11509 length:732 start_codon:yes stop_codon:yes gene_type:complete